nr:hypothetical protein [Tanacetum cinerariifolium]GEX55578.1 hypothetical protein [Tanacetum cinerariifolium]
MSDSEDSMVTYTKVSSLFEDLSDIGSPRVDGLPMMSEDPYAYVKAALQAPPSPDYVPGPEHPPTLAFVLEPVYPEFVTPEDDVLPSEERPLLAAVSPTADSPGYIPEFDPEEDPEEDDEDLEEDQLNTPPTRMMMMRTRIRMRTGRRSTKLQPTLLLAIPTPPPSPLSSFSSPLTHILSPPLPISSLPLPTGPSYPLGYRAAMIRLRVEASYTSHPLPSSLRFEVSETSFAPTARPNGGFRADYRFVGTLDDEIRHDPEREVGYGITYTWDEMVKDMLGTLAVTDVAGLSQRMTDFVTTIRHDNDEIYRRLDDAQDDRLLMSGQLNMLRRDRRAHARNSQTHGENGAHIGYNCPPKVPIISNPEPCYNQNVDEFPQTLPSFHPTCYYGDENSFTYDSNLSFVDDSPNPPPQPPTNSYEFCENDAYYGHDWPPQFPIIHQPPPATSMEILQDQENLGIELAEYINTPSWNRPTFYNYDDNDDEDYTISITPVLSTEEPVDSLIMEDDESKGILDNMCDVPFRDNSPPLDISKDQFEYFFDFNDDSTSIDNDYFSIDDIDYVEASPPDSELVSLEEVKDDILHEKLLNIHLLIAKIESLNDNPTPDRVLKSLS